MIIQKVEHFGTPERIKEWIEAEGITREAFAERLGVDDRSIRRWFSGTKIRRNNLIKIAEVMDCDIEYLECKQGTPRRSSEIRIRLSDLSIVDRYLPKIHDLVKSTSQCFEYSIGAESGSVEQISGSFIEGDCRYYYEDYLPEYTGKLFYKISINGSEPIQKSEEEMTDFVKGIMKYISFEIEQLK